MSKEWWICQKYQYGGSGHAEKCFYASKSKESVLDHSGGNLIGKPIHVVEYQALADKDKEIAELKNESKEQLEATDLAASMLIKNRDRRIEQLEKALRGFAIFVKDHSTEESYNHIEASKILIKMENTNE